MKGIVNFLEKAGLVTMDEPVEQATAEPESGGAVDFSLGPTSADPVLAEGSGAPLNFEDVYANAGVSWSMWSYKAAHGVVPDGWGWYDPSAFPPVPNIANSSPATIAAAWQSWKTRTAFVRNSSGIGF